jgi:hypothetical protein
MRLSEIERKAKGLGIRDTWKFSKKDLIKTIQRSEGFVDCFGTTNAKAGCSQMACCWRTDCLR